MRPTNEHDNTKYVVDCVVNRLFWFVVFNIQEDPVALFSTLISWYLNFCIQRYKEFHDRNSNYQFSKTSSTIKITFLCHDKVYI